jgi:hypothetical protein
MNTATWEKLEHKVRNSRISSRFDNCESCAIIAGPAIVVEAIVYKASHDSKIDMDWHYCGGRGIVYALGDRAKARHALQMAMVVTDLTMGDI